MKMMGGNGKMGYDRAIVTFSPDGRLFQVEYAREAVKRATTSVGIKYSDGVILAGLKRTNKLSTEKGNKKVHQIDEHIGAASAGLIADGRTIIDHARTRSQIYRISYREPMDVRTLAEEIGDLKQKHTQYGGLRPMGVTFLIGGYDRGPELYETDVGGAVYGWNAQVIGSGRKEGRKILEENWHSEIEQEEAMELAVNVLKEGEEVVNEDTVKMTVIDEEGYRMIEDREKLKELL